MAYGNKISASSSGAGVGQVFSGYPTPPMPNVTWFGAWVCNTGDQDGYISFDGFKSSFYIPALMAVPAGILCNVSDLSLIQIQGSGSMSGVAVTMVP